MRSRALVLGGTGAVGSEVVRLIAKRVPTAFSFHSNEARAAELSKETGAQAIPLDLVDPRALNGLTEKLDGEGAFDVLIHCAAPSLTKDDLDTAYAIHGRATFNAVKLLAPKMKTAGGGDIVLFGAIDRAQSLPLPSHLAAAHGMAAAMAMALAKEHGADGIRINLIALGLLESGLSRALDPALVDEYRKFSALHRLGSPSEAARVACWVALDSTYLSGKVVSCNGGI